MPQKDAIDEFIALPNDEQMRRLGALTRDKQDLLLQKVKERRSKQPSAIGQTTAPVATSTTKVPVATPTAQPKGRPFPTVQYPSTAATKQKQDQLADRRAIAHAQYLSNLPSFSRPENYPAWQAPLDLAIGAEQMLGIDPMRPIATTPGAIKNLWQNLMQFGNIQTDPGGTKSIPAMWEAIKRTATAANRARQEQNLPEMYQSLGQFGVAAQPVAGAVEAGLGVVRAGAGSLADVAGLRERARNVLRQSLKSTPEEIEKPKLEEASAKIAETQQKQAEANLAAAEKTQASKEKVAQEVEERRTAAHNAARGEALDRSVQEGSTRLGERVSDLDGKLRQEGNEKYTAVRNAVKNDPGVPLAGLAQAAKHAEDNILKGSPENIKQFRDLARKAPEEAGVQTSIGELQPGDPLYERLKSEGALDLGGNITFDQLQGYSSEIGERLARGGLQGDVYQALKYLKDEIDKAKTTIAERNNAGGLLRNADSFWRSYMDLFYDSDSALAKVREGVGTKNPSEAFNEFMRGRGDEIAIGRLKRLRTRHADDASAIADLSQNLKSATREADTLKGTRVPGRPEPPTRAVPKQIPQEQLPTVESFAKVRREKLLNTFRNWRATSIFELHRLGYAVNAATIGFVAGHSFATAGLGAVIAFATPKIVAAIMSNPEILDFLTAPTEDIMDAAENLPPDQKLNFQNNVRDAINQSQAAGRPVNVSPRMSRFLGLTAVGAVTAPVQNRKDAMERLGRNPTNPTQPSASARITPPAARPATAAASMTLDDFNARLDRLLPPGDARFTDANRRFSVMAGDAPASQLGDILARAQAEAVRIGR
jgi:hypothetical protein